MKCSCIDKKDSFEEIHNFDNIIRNPEQTIVNNDPTSYYKVNFLQYEHASDEYSLDDEIAELQQQPRSLSLLGTVLDQITGGDLFQDLDMS